MSKEHSGWTPAKADTQSEHTNIRRSRKRLEEVETWPIEQPRVGHNNGELYRHDHHHILGFLEDHTQTSVGSTNYDFSYPDNSTKSMFHKLPSWLDSSPRRLSPIKACGCPVRTIMALGLLSTNSSLKCHCLLN